VVLLQVLGRLVQQQPEQRLPEDLALQRVSQQQLQLRQSRPAIHPQAALAQPGLDKSARADSLLTCPLQLKPLIAGAFFFLWC
jgi:hypothetical protein